MTPRGAASTVALMAAAMLAGDAGCEPGRASPQAAAPTPARPDPRPDVLLVVVDCLRRDHVGAYGYSRATTPHLDELARRGVRFERAYSHAPWTTAAIGALITSRYPDDLGITNDPSALPTGVPTLATVLRGVGYRTGAAVSHLYCSRRWGFAEGFAEFDESGVEESQRISSEKVTSAALRFLATCGSQPCFLMLHYFDPHLPYLAHDGLTFGGPAPSYTGPVRSGMSVREVHRLVGTMSAADIAELARLYDSEIAFVDRNLGRVLEAIERRGRLADTLVIVTADHGEAFLEHGHIAHTRSLYEELISVPLVAALPRSHQRWPPGTVVRYPVAHVDVFPTVLEVAGIAAPGGLAGSSLLSASGWERRPIHSVTLRGARLRSVVLGDWKLILNVKSGRKALYQLSQDPSERRNLAALRTDIARELSALAEARDTAPKADEARVELSEEDRARLRSLGYLDSPAPAPTPAPTPMPRRK